MGNLTFDSIARVEEIVTDVLAMDLLHSSPSFFANVLEVAGEPHANLVAIRRSVVNSSLGETDIELVVEGLNGRCGILIENKVRAPLMNRQFARYRMRGDEGIRKGKWARFRMILMSPRSYFEALGVEHSQHIDANLSYEDIVLFLAQHPEFAFKRHVFESAIIDSRQGYVKSPDKTMMDFYQNYWAVASNEFPQLHMAKPDIVGRDSSCLPFPPLYSNTRIRLIHKFKFFGCELAVPTQNAEKLEEELRPFLEADMTVRPKKLEAFINIKTPAIDHTRDFTEIRDDVVFSLQTLERLRLFAMDEKVRQCILQHAARTR